MKFFYILFFIIFSQIIYSQSFEYIKKLDTIYIPFRANEYNIKIDYPEEKNGFKNRSYLFNLKKENNNTFYFEFDRYSNKILERKKISKSFLNKIKKNIVEIHSLQNFDYQEIACFLFSRLKTIYIIDFSKNKDEDIMLYKVISLNRCYSIE